MHSLSAILGLFVRISKPEFVPTPDKGLRYGAIRAAEAQVTPLVRGKSHSWRNPLQRLADHGDAESRCDKGEGAGGPAWIPIGAAWKPGA